MYNCSDGCNKKKRFLNQFTWKKIEIGSCDILMEKKINEKRYITESLWKNIWNLIEFIKHYIRG